MFDTISQVISSNIISVNEYQMNRVNSILHVDLISIFFNSLSSATETALLFLMFKICSHSLFD